MPATPNAGRWPRRVPEADQGYFTIDNRDPGTDNYSRVGPYMCSIIPSGGQYEVPATNESRGEARMVLYDAKIYAPAESNAAARSVLTNVLMNVSYTVVYAGRWKDVIECYVKRRAGR